MSEDRFFVLPLSLGDAGLAQRPSVIDREQRPARVKSFKSNEEHLAEALAALLNSGELTREDFEVKAQVDSDRRAAARQVRNARLGIRPDSPRRRPRKTRRRKRTR